MQNKKQNMIGESEDLTPLLEWINAKGDLGEIRDITMAADKEKAQSNEPGGNA